MTSAQAAIYLGKSRNALWLLVSRGVTCSPVYGLRIVLKEERRPEILKLDEIRGL
jgi:hypothetical protein